MGKIMDAIDSQIIRPRVVASESEGFQMTQEDIQNFYSSGSPRYYQRTGTYESSPRSSGVSGGNGNYHYKIHLNVAEYPYGDHSGLQIMTDIQNHGSGVLGTPGTWADAAEDIIEAVKGHFS